MSSSASSETISATAGDLFYLDYRDWLPRQSTLQKKLRVTASKCVHTPDRLFKPISLPELVSDEVMEEKEEREG